jgi:hypothetical protein
MTILVENVNDVWVAFTGNTPKQMSYSLATCEIRYHDGRVITDVPCDPYTVTDVVVPSKVVSLYDQEIWGEDDLERYGLKVAIPFEVPEGYQAIGDQSFVEDEDGVVFEHYETEPVG